jgi:hypothetical protein
MGKSIAQTLVFTVCIVMIKILNIQSLIQGYHPHSKRINSECLNMPVYRYVSVL